MGVTCLTNKCRCRQAGQHSLSFFHSSVTYVTFTIAMSNERLPGIEEDLLIRSLTSSLYTLSLEGVSVQQMIEQKKRRKLVELRLERAVREQSAPSKLSPINFIRIIVKLIRIPYSMSRLWPTRSCKQTLARMSTAHTE